MVLLDTQALVWMMEGLALLGSRSRELVSEARASSAVLVSTISFWEVAMLASKGRLQLRHPLDAWRRQVLGMGVTEVAVSGPLSLAAGMLSDVSGDPADGIILATAIEEGAMLITADRQLLDWPGSLSKHDART